MPKMRYVGEGAYVSGVPARDLSSEEWDAVSERLQQKALDAGTHEASKKTKSAKIVEESDNG